MDENENQTKGAEPTVHDLEQLLDRLTKPTYVWRLARALADVPHPRSERAYGPRARGAQTRRQNALQEVRETLELLGWRYRGADHDSERTADELLR